MSDLVIRAENLSKYYKLGVINNGTLFRDIQTWWDLKRGRQDRHSKIGSHKFDGNADGFWALKDLNFNINQGDRVGIIGHNGAGKSTLLKILSRITAPTEGKVKIKGRIASLLEVGTGFHGELTGRENIYLNGAILGMKKKEVDRKIDEIIAFSEIEQHIDTPVKRYSSGMYVRLAFAVAAHLDSEILIADEVLAVGDSAFQKKALGKMNDLSTGQGRTVLFVSHNMAQVKNLCTKGIVLEKGQIVRQDDDINKSIDWYLGLDDKQKNISNSYSWCDFTNIGNSFFKPIEIKILNQDNNVFNTPINYNENFKFYIKFSVEEKSNFDFSLKISKGIDSISQFYKNEPYELGIHEVFFEVPKRTFYPGTYFLVLNASNLTQKSWIVDSSRLDFSVPFSIIE